MDPVDRAPRRRGRPRSDRARRAILEATRDQLAEHGYERLSIQQIADAAGVGKQTVYRWWTSKRALVAECVLEGYVLSVGEGPADSGDLHGDIRAWFHDLAAHYGKEPQASLLRALTAAAAESEDIAAKLLARFGEPYRSTVAARLGAAQGSGQVRPDAPLGLVAEALVGALVFRVLSREPVDPDAMLRLADTLLAGIVTSSARSSRA